MPRQTEGKQRDLHLRHPLSRAMAQAVSRWLPTAAARVRAWSGHVGFVVDKVALRQVFSEYFGFPCQSSFHQIHILIISRGRYNRSIGARRAEWTYLGGTIRI
jgi:hypothetical protein